MGDSQKFALENSPQIAKIIAIHQNFRRYCRKAILYPICSSATPLSSPSNLTFWIDVSCKRVVNDEKHFAEADQFSNLWQVWTERNELVIGVIGPIWWDLNFLTGAHRAASAHSYYCLHHHFIIVSLLTGSLIDQHQLADHFRETLWEVNHNCWVAEKKIITCWLLGPLLLCYQCPGPLQSFTEHFFQGSFCRF